MATESLIAGNAQLQQAIERRRKREAAAKTAAAMQSLGGEIKSSQTGKTDIGQFVGSAIEKGLVENPAAAFALLRMSPEQWSTELGMRAFSDKSIMPLADKSMKLLGQINYTKAAAQARARAAYATRGSGGKDEKLGKLKIDLNTILPTVLAEVAKKFPDAGLYDSKNNLISIDRINMREVQRNLANSGQLPAFDEAVYQTATNILKNNYKELNYADSIGSLVDMATKTTSMFYAPNFRGFGTFVEDEKGGGAKQFKFNTVEANIPQSVLIDSVKNAIEGRLYPEVETEIIPAEERSWTNWFPSSETKKTKINFVRKKNGEIVSPGFIEKPRLQSVNNEPPTLNSASFDFFAGTPFNVVNNDQGNDQDNNQ